MMIEAIGLSCLIPEITYALPDDKSKTMQLSADYADLNQTTHLGIYKHHVAFDQGTTHMRAAAAITTGNEKNELTKASIQGDHHLQAHYWTTTTIDKPPMHAYADLITYYPAKHLIELAGRAKIQQGDNIFAAPKIVYDTLHQHVITQFTKAERTKIIIHPSNLHD
jgi:lipopolysaccharide export system protein LptA